MVSILGKISLEMNISETKVGLPHGGRDGKVRLMRWFGLVETRYTDAPTQRCKRFAMDGVTSDRGRLEKY